MYNLERFIEKQKIYYDKALAEIKNGYKSSHWIWFIFPQLKGLGNSNYSDYYGISNLEEAKEYYNNEYLKNNLIEISKSLLSIENKNIKHILHYPDNLKIKSCMTLFEIVDPEQPVFKKVLDKYYSGNRDSKTIELIKNK